MFNWLLGLDSDPPHKPSPADCEAWLRRNVAHFALLSKEEQDRLLEDVPTFVAENNWEGCRGLQVTDEMKVTIAGQACLMILGLNLEYFNRISSILVYPAAFRMPKEDWDLDSHPATGQAVYRGPVILSWDNVLAEGRDPSRGDNLVIHEFAHHLDFLDRSANGTPNLLDPELEDRWTNVMTEELERLRRNIRKGRDTFLGDYAGKNEAEFFAVTSERFFTVPVGLRHCHPELYDLLTRYYRVDPSRWFAAKEQS